MKCALLRAPGVPCVVLGIVSPSSGGRGRVKVYLAQGHAERRQQLHGVPLDAALPRAGAGGKEGAFQLGPRVFADANQEPLARVCFQERQQERHGRERLRHRGREERRQEKEGAGEKERERERRKMEKHEM
jgi:hypothetical protein